MQEIAVYDLDGNTLTNLVQFDKDVYINIKDSRITAAYQVQFFNSTSESALVMNSTYSNGILKVKIPNDLLEQPYSITGYVNVIKNNENKCLYAFKIAVRKKPKPNNWVHVDSSDYVTFEKIVEECREYASNAGTSATNAKTSERNAKASENAASNSAANAKNSETNAANSAAAALISENKAKASEDKAYQSELRAKESEKATDKNVGLTEKYAHAAEVSEENALDSEKKASQSAATAMSYAVGNGSDFLLDSDGNIISTSDDNAQIYMSYFREGEETENAKYYYEQAKANSQDAKSSKDIAVTSAANAKNSETNAANSAAAALISENKAKASEVASATSETNAKTSEVNAKTSETNAKTSETKASTSEQNAKTYSDNAKTSEDNAKTSEDNAATSEGNAKTSETNAKASADSAKDDADRAETARTNIETYADLAKSYSVGTDNTVRPNDTTDNAKYYYEQSRQISAGLSGALLPMGTIPFANLSIQTKMSGYMFNISDAFVTDATFKEGAGHQYPAGTNVYYTSDGYWDCLAGTLVTGVKGNKETNYRIGNVNLTPENIGAQSIEDAATMQSEIDNVEGDITNIQGDISTLQTDLQTVEDNMDGYVADLLKTITTLQDTVALLETMIYTGSVLSYLVDSNGDNIVTNDGVGIYAWHEL